MNESMWRGKPLSEMSREELIKALETIGRLYFELLKEREREADSALKARASYRQSDTHIS